MPRPAAAGAAAASRPKLPATAFEALIAAPAASSAPPERAGQPWAALRRLERAVVRRRSMLTDGYADRAGLHFESVLRESKLAVKLTIECNEQSQRNSRQRAWGAQEAPPGVTPCRAQRPVFRPFKIEACSCISDCFELLTDGHGPDDNTARLCAERDGELIFALTAWPRRRQAVPRGPRKRAAQQHPAPGSLSSDRLAGMRAPLRRQPTAGARQGRWQQHGWRQGGGEAVQTCPAPNGSLTHG